MVSSFIRALLAIGLLASSARASGSIEWGPSNNGLRMSAAIIRNDFGNNELEATIENTTSKEILIVLGHIAQRFAEAVHVVVRTPGGLETAAFYLDSGGGVAPGRFLPMVLPLPARSCYTIRTLLGGWGYYAPSLQRVEELLSQPSSLRLELHNSIEERVRYGVRVGCYGARQFWNGTLVSNTLQFPLTTSPGPARIPANGRTINDLRMSVTVVRNEVGHPELDVCIQNTGLREYILPFGQSGFGYPSAVRMYVRKPNEASASVFRWGAGRAATQIESIPMVVPMLPRSDYRVRTPLDKWRMPAPDGRSLQELIRQRLFLYLEFRVRPDEPHRYLNVDCFPVSIPPPPPPGRRSRQAPAGHQLSWSGTLVSNTLTFPHRIANVHRPTSIP